MNWFGIVMLGILQLSVVSAQAREKVSISPKGSSAPVKEDSKSVRKDETKESTQEVLRVLDGYRTGMESLSVEKLGLVMDPELLVLEHGGIDKTWAAYRDAHIGEHMKEWKSLKVSDVDLLEMSVSEGWAYAAQRARNTIVTAGDRATVVLDVTESFVLKRGPEGWKIKHLHISLKKKS